MKFKVGDKVRVRSDLPKDYKYYTSAGECNLLNKQYMLGKIATIKEVNSSHYYLEEDGRNHYIDEMLELVEEQSIKYGVNLSKIAIGIDGITIRTLPKQVFFNDKKKTTVLKWEDNSITKVKCNDDEFDEKVGFLIAYFQHTCGLSKNKANKYLDSLVPEDKPMEETPKKNRREINNGIS
jgi:hypothetical protein